MRVMISTGILACVLLAAGPVRAQNTTARAAIEAGNKAFVAAFNKHDAAAIAAVYSSTAEAFPPNSEIVKGRDAIQKMWQGVLDQGIDTVDLATTEVHAEGTLAYEVGTYAMKTKDGKAADHGKYCVVWIKEAGQWKLHRDIWSTNVPAPAK